MWVSVYKKYYFIFCRWVKQYPTAFHVVQRPSVEEMTGLAQDMDTDMGEDGRRVAAGAGARAGAEAGATAQKGKQRDTIKTNGVNTVKVKQ